MARKESPPKLDERSHTYTQGDRLLVGVTSVLDENGLVSEWSKNAEAAERGSAVHLATRLYDEGKKDTLAVHLRETVEMGTAGYLEAWKAFLAATRFRVKMVEKLVHEKSWGYAGTLDRFGVYRKGEALLDIKSNEAGKVPPATALQLAAYGHALKNGRRFIRLGVALKPNGTFSLVEYPVSQYLSDVQDFLALVRASAVRRRLARA